MLDVNAEAMISNSEMEPEVTVVEEAEDMQQQEHTVLTDNDSNLSNEPAEAKGSSASLKQNGEFLVLAIGVLFQFAVCFIHNSSY